MKSVAHRSAARAHKQALPSIAASRRLLALVLLLLLAFDPGDALLFWDYVPGEPEDRLVPDPFSLHGGCPVVEGTKNIVTRWIRSTEFV